MRTKLTRITQRIAYAVLFSLCACGAQAQVIPLDELPKPEDPVVLPTAEETARTVANIRETSLMLLKWDADGWDDLWVMIQKSRDKDYKFDPNDKRKDTDGDGYSDYEEMLTHRSATYKEPIYTKAELIAQIREERRMAIVRENARLVSAAARFAEMAPFTPRLIEVNGRAETVTKPRIVERQQRAADAERAAGLQISNEQALRAAAARHGMELEERKEGGGLTKFSGTHLGAPLSTTTDNHFSAQLSGVTALWPAGLNPITPPVVTPALTGLWATGASGLNLTGAGTRLGVFEVGAVFDASFTQHEDLGSNTVTPETNRVLWQVDNTSVSNFHANAVAGVLIGRGSRDLSSWLSLPIRNGAANTIVDVPIGRAARGMSFEAQASAWDIQNTLTEVPASFSAHNIRLSNHSYGLTAGWQLRGPGLLPRWWGTAGTTEDYKFGYYQPVTQGPATDNAPQSRGFDDFTSSAVFYLPVMSAGNDRLSEPAGQIAAPPTGIPHEELNASNQWVASSAYRAPDGDAGGYDTVRSPGTAKNVLTVGSLSVTFGVNGGATTVALEPSSGRGPTDDGRIKPEIVAKGAQAVTADNNTSTEPLNTDFGSPATAYQVISGTSFAAPSVAGGLNLCAQRYAQLYPQRQPLHASTWRVLAVHTANDAFGAPGPSYGPGYGIFSASDLALLIQQDFNSGSDAFIHEAPVFNEPSGQPKDFIEFKIRAAGGVGLKVTSGWTDPQGDAPPSVAVDGLVDVLKNDMALTVTAPDGTVWRPWVLNPDLANESVALRELPATRGANHFDNLEQVMIPAASVVASGIYTVRVEREDVMTTALQWVSLAVSGQNPLPRPALAISKLTAGTAANTWLVEWPAIVGREYQVQISPNLQSWSNIATPATASKETVAQLVTVPSGQARYFFRVKETQ
jgi:hypothetical protein